MAQCHLDAVVSVDEFRRRRDRADGDLGVVRGIAPYTSILLECGNIEIAVVLGSRRPRSRLHPRLRGRHEGHEDARHERGAGEERGEGEAGEAGEAGALRGGRHRRGAC